jgi:predicted nucleotidyltransferase
MPRGGLRHDYNPYVVATDLESQNASIVEHLRRSVDGVIAVYRFGSTAKGAATAGSDVDVAVLTREPLPAARRFDAQEALAAAIGCDVDLVDLRGASPVMAIQVVAHGQLLYDGDSSARGGFEDRTFGAYARLNEERRAILDRVAAEGTVYGR